MKAVRKTKDPAKKLLKDERDQEEEKQERQAKGESSLPGPQSNVQE